MKLKTFLTNFGLYLLAFLSYLFIFFTIVAYTVRYLAGGFSQLLILPIFVILAVSILLPCGNGTRKI